MHRTRARCVEVNLVENRSLVVHGYDARLPRGLQHHVEQMPGRLRLRQIPGFRKRRYRTRADAPCAVTEIEQSVVVVPPMPAQTMRALESMVIVLKHRRHTVSL